MYLNKMYTKLMLIISILFILVDKRFVSSQLTLSYSSLFPISAPKQANVIEISLMMQFATNHGIACGSLVVDEINNSTTIFPNHELRLRMYNVDGADSGPTIRHCLNITSRSEASKLVIGPGSYADQCQHIFAGNYMQVAYLGGPAILSDKSLYPTYTRIDPPHIDQAKPLVELCLKMNWKRVAILADGSNYIEIMQEFIALAVQNNIELVTTQTFTSAGRGLIQIEGLNIRNSLDLIKQTDARILILLIFQRDVGTIMNQLEEKGMNQSPYQLVGFNEWIRFDPMFVQSPKLRTQLHGTWGIMIPYQQGLYDAFAARWKQKKATDEAAGYNTMRGVATPQILSTQIYDSMMVGILAYDKMLKLRSNCPTNSTYDVNNCPYIGLSDAKLLFRLTLQVNYQGLSGRILFNSVGDRIPEFHIVNLRDTGSPTTAAAKERVIVGNWKNETSSVLFTDTMPDTAYVWTGGALGITNKPLDKDLTIQPGDKLRKSINFIIVIASYVLATFGAWSCLILLEQVLFDQSKHKSATQSRIIATTVLSFCTLWSCNWLEMSSISLSNGVDINYSPIVVILSILVSWISVWFAFQIILSNMVNTIRKMKNYQVKKKVSPDGDEDKVDKSSLSYVLTYFWKSCRSSNIIATAIIMLGEGIFHILMVIDLDMYATISYSNAVGEIIGAIIISFICFSLGLQGFFYLKRGRFIAAFIFAAGLVGGNQLAFSGQEFFYHIPSSRHYSSYSNWSSELLLIICSVTGAVTCFIFLFVQFNKMRLSRNSLDLLLEKSKRALADVDLKYAIAKNEIKLHVDGIKELQTELELINLGRSIDSDDLLAWGLGVRNRAIIQSKEWQGNNFDNSSTGNNRVATNDNGKDQSDKNSSKQNNTVNAIRIRPKTTNNRNIKQVQDDDGSGQDNATSAQGNNLLYDTNNNINNNEGSLQQITQTLGMNGLGLIGDNIDETKIKNNTFLYYWKLAINKLSGSYGATPEIYLKNVSMHDVLSDPFCLELFKESVRRDMSSESLEFWLTVQTYKKLPQMESNIDKLQELRNEFGRSISAQFLGNDSKTPINVSSTLSNVLISLINKGTCTSTTFDEAEKEIRKLLEQNNFIKFQERREFQLCAIKLNKIPQISNIRSNPAGNNNSERTNTTAMEVNRINNTQTNSVHNST